MTYTSLIFDFDGTLFDTRNAIAATLQQTLRDCLMEVPDESAIWHTIRLGITLEKTFEMLLTNPNESDIAKCVKYYRDIYNGGMGVENSHPYPGIPTLLNALYQAGNVIVICSNKGRTAVESTLSHYGLESVACCIIAADASQPTKPDPASFITRIKPQIGDKAAERPLVIGDTVADIEFAKAINSSMLWASYGYGNPELCRPMAPELIAEASINLYQILIESGNLPAV